MSTVGHVANQRVCAKCGRTAHMRTMRYTIRGTYECARITACEKRRVAKEKKADVQP